MEGDTDELGLTDGLTDVLGETDGDSDDDGLTLGIPMNPTEMSAQTLMPLVTRCSEYVCTQNS